MTRELKLYVSGAAAAADAWDDWRRFEDAGMREAIEHAQPVRVGRGRRPLGYVLRCSIETAERIAWSLSTCPASDGRPSFDGPAAWTRAVRRDAQAIRAVVAHERLAQAAR